MLIELNKKDSANNTKITLIIIGFLTYLYGPFITIALVSILGRRVRVPSPTLYNNQLQSINNKSPNMLNFD